MTSIKKLAAGLSALGLLAVAAPAFAIPALTYTTNTTLGAGTYVLDVFNGFDYISNGSAVSTPVVYDGVTVSTTTYLASANAVLDADGNPFFTPGIAPATPLNDGIGAEFNPFEFTIKATIFEVAVCTVPGPNPGDPCVQAAFYATGGTFDIYYDVTADANRALGTGYLDGTRIMGGSITPGLAGSFLVNSAGTGGSGNFSFFGEVTFTETDNTKDAFVAPELKSTKAGAEIKIGTSTTSWTAPTSWVDGGGFPQDGLIFQADGNQSFSTPEPGTLAILGLGLVGIFASARRRNA